MLGQTVKSEVCDLNMKDLFFYEKILSNLFTFPTMQKKLKFGFQKSYDIWLNAAVKQGNGKHNVVEEQMRAMGLL